MKALCFGSLNIDYVYRVHRFVAPGETLPASDLRIIPGGKGLNQSIALAKAGMQVYHAGCIGREGSILKDCLEVNGVDTSCVETREIPQGHAIIQVDDAGENCIIVYAGSNCVISEPQVDATFERFTRGDILLVQNETNMLNYIVETAFGRGMRIALNPSPCDSRIDGALLSKVDWLICNAMEFSQLGNGRIDLDDCWNTLHQQYPNMSAVVTLGKNGSVAFRVDGTSIEKLEQDSFEVEAVDTTGAGDTFAGFFLGSIYRNRSLCDSLRVSAMASALAVTMPGASTAMPELSNVEAALNASCYKIGYKNDSETSN